MSFKTSILRGIKYVLHGVPVINMKAEITTLSSNTLLKGKTALITGGTSGIGLAIADAFIGAGAKVIITSRHQMRIDEAILKIKENRSSAQVTGIVLDSRNIDQSTKLINELFSTVDIDILVNNAGINGGLLKSCTEEEYQSVMDTNLKGVVFITRTVTDNMIKKNIKGNILNICSSSSVRPANTAYVLSKWGLRGYTLGLAKSLIKHGIVVNGLAPGPTLTPMIREDDTNDISLPNNPSGRYSLPEEIANMAVILTSGIGRMVVGDIIYMTGGAGLLTFDDIQY